MINATEQRREARHGLQELSASDPAARANMLRHVAAYTQLLMGRGREEALPGEPMVFAGFRLMDGDEKLFASLTRRDGIGRTYIAFDIDDAQGPPIGVGLFLKEDEHVICYGICKLWSPLGSGRALLVPISDGKPLGYFKFQRGGSFRWVQGPVPGDLMGGLHRSKARLDRLLTSAEADAVSRRGSASAIRSVGHAIVTQPLSLSA